MKKVLVTGAAGFLGSHICERFLEDDFKVVGMDNFITGSKQNIELLAQWKNFEFIEHDVSNFIKISGDLDYILHFASPASPIDYLKIPIQTLKVSSLGTHNLLGLAKAKKAVILVCLPNPGGGWILYEKNKYNRFWFLGTSTNKSLC